MPPNAEILARTAVPLDPTKFNPRAVLPYGLQVSHIREAMQEFLDFLSFLNSSLLSRDLGRMETMMMPANFSAMVGEFVIASIPKHFGGLVKNKYHNGHPDLIRVNAHRGDSVQYCDQGLEVKASRYDRGWQGHNAEDVWLMVVVFDGNRPRDADGQGDPPRPFVFRRVVAARLDKSDWNFSGRKEGSRRTITASVTPSGYSKLMANWVYMIDPPSLDRTKRTRSPKK